MRTSSYQMMIWWRHYSKVNGIYWIETSEERRINQEVDDIEDKHTNDEYLVAEVQEVLYDAATHIHAAMSQIFRNAAR